MRRVYGIDRDTTITFKVGSPGDYGPTGPQGPAGDRGQPGRTPGTLYFHHVYNNFKNDILETKTKQFFTIFCSH